jgi:large subunit ribosomal protein L10
MELWRVFARHLLRGKDFLFGKEVNTLAITKERKNELIAQYTEWVKRSKALVVTQYAGLTMKDIDALRARVREAGGEFHIVKNTLVKKTFEQAGMSFPSEEFEGSTAIAFAFNDAPAIAKIMTEVAKASDFVKIKGGYLDRQPISIEGVKSLADLPPLPVMRAQLLGTLLAPASQLVRLLAEPGRQVAAVIKAKYEPAEPVPA